MADYKQYNYYATRSGRENLNQVLMDCGYPKEYLDDIEIVAVRPSSDERYASYTEKSGNTAVEVNYSGELVNLTGGKYGNVHFYNRTLPIPYHWKNKVMVLLDTELDNLDIVTYVKNRFTKEGYPFIGERLTYELKEGTLKYGTNKLEITPRRDSYGLAGTAQLCIQYLADLNKKMTKLVTTVNPFLTQDSISKKEMYNELAVIPGKTSKETDSKILSRFLVETYGERRARAVLEEIQAEGLNIVRSPTFRAEIANPATPEQEIEKLAAKNYLSSILYRLSEDQEKDQYSRIYGNIRMMVGISDISKLVAESGKFEMDVEQESKYRESGIKVKSFVLASDTGDGSRFDIQLGKHEDAQKAFESARSLIRRFFGVYADLVEIERNSATDSRIEISVLPGREISDYVGGELRAYVTYSTKDEVVLPKITVSLNLNGFAEVVTDQENGNAVTGISADNAPSVLGDMRAAYNAARG